MKKKLLCLVLALILTVGLLPAGALAAEEGGQDYDLRVLTFEDSDYKGGTNFAGESNWTSLIDSTQYGGKMLYPNGSGTTDESEAYTWTDSGNTELKHTLPASWGNYCYWGGGHAVSNYVSGEFTEYGDFNNQLTVYKKDVEGLQRTGGGHNGSDNFAVHFGYKDNSGYTDSQILPSISFSDGVARVVDHMYINNICYAVNCYLNGNGLTAKIGENDWVKLIAIGYDAEGNEVSTKAEIYLCNGPDNIILDWTKWDLSVLGAVTKVEFNITGSSDNGYGFSQPAYFAYDDVAVRFPKEKVDVSAITLDKEKMELKVGESGALTATVAPDNATDKTVTWTSSEDSVATVSEDGTVTAVSAGTAVITAASGGLQSQCTVTVKAEESYDLRVLTFEDSDYKGGTNFAGGNNWTSLIDSPQYGGNMLYGSSGGGVTTKEEAYTWTDTGNTELSNTLCNGYGSWCYWSGGHAVSNYVSGEFTKYGDFNNQLTVYKKDVEGLQRTGGGHNGSDNFAVHYGYMDGSSFNMTTELPALRFADGKARVIDHMYVNNICYAVNCYLSGNGLTAKIEEDDWVKLVATGYDAEGKEVSTKAEIYLCDGPDNIILDWTKWDLSVLGAVTRVDFNVTGSSDNGYGFSQPAYFAYDDVAVRVEKSGESGGTGEPEEPEVTAPISVKSGDTSYKVSKVEAPAGSTGEAYRVSVPADTASITVQLDGAEMIGVQDIKDNYVDGAYENPFTLTASGLKKLLLNDTQIEKNVTFTPGEASQVAYLKVTDWMAFNEYYLFIELTRDAVHATSVTLDQSTLAIKEGEKAVLTATVAPENTTDKLTWTSSDDTVATVKDGTVTAVKEGSAIITAACGEVKAACNVTVTGPTKVTGIELDKSAVDMFTGEKTELFATVSPDDADNKNIIWSSDNESAATVKDGTVIAAGQGTAVITAKTEDGEFTAECTVAVSEPKAPAQDSQGVYQIGTVSELVWFGQQINSGKTNISAVLTKDIDLNGRSWTPAGTEENPFCGSFDGDGHTVSGLAVYHNTKNGSNYLYQGMFGYVLGTKEQSAVIKNLTVEGSVKAEGSDAVWNAYVGGVIGKAEYTELSGIISKVDVTVIRENGYWSYVGGLAGSMLNCKTENCGNEGDVLGYKDLGGITSWVYGGTLDSSYNTGDVTGTGDGYAGGITCYAKQSTISNVYNTGDITIGKSFIGGLIGTMENATLTNGYTTGKVVTKVSGAATIGAAIGWADKGGNVYYLENTAESGIGKGDMTVVSKTDTELKSDDMLVSLGEGFKKDAGNINEGYPVLVWQPSEEPVTGLVNIDGQIMYYTDGELDTSKNGVARMADGSDKNWYYVENGVFKEATGIARRADGSNNNWYYVQDGIYKKATGIARYADGSSKNWYYVEKGQYKKSTGIARYADGNSKDWYYVQNGKYIKATGIAQYADGSSNNWYYVQNGKYTKATGIAQKADGTSKNWYYVSGGRYRSDYTGLAPRIPDGKLFYVRNGVYRSNFNGTVKYNGKTYTVKNGRAV